MDACFDITDVPRKVGESKKHHYKYKFCKNNAKVHEGNQRPREHVLACDVHGKACKGCALVHIHLRNGFRAPLEIPAYEESTSE